MPPMPQEYVAIVGNAPNVPPQAYVAVVDASGNVISGSYGPPGGRLTLTTLTPVLAATVSAAATVLYTPYNSDIVPIFNGTSWLMTQFAELSNVLANSSVGNAGPAAAANNSNYDLFVWNNAGVMTLTRGPLWTSDTARSAGTALVMVNGLLLNAVAITNGPAIQRGTYVGTIRTNGTATTDFNVGTGASGGGAALFGIWNCYNRRPAVFQVSNSDAAWTYSSNVTRAAAGTNGIRVSYVRGLNEDAVSVRWIVRVQSPATAGALYTIGIAADVTNLLGSVFVTTQSPAAAVAIQTPSVSLDAYTGLGFHFLQATEQGDNANTFTVGGTAVNLYQGVVWL